MNPVRHFQDELILFIISDDPRFEFWVILALLIEILAGSVLLVLESQENREFY